MREIRCRNCGATIEMPKYHGPKLVLCPECGWEEIIPARHRLPEKLDNLAGAAFQQLQLKRAKMSRLAERIDGFSPGDFKRFCEDLFAATGHSVVEADAMLDESHDFELTVEEQRVLVKCERHSVRHAVEREEIENLAGAMRHAGAPRGIYVTAGTFDKASFELARGEKVNLIDGQTIKKMIEAVDPEAMRAWWEEEEGGFDLEEAEEGVPEREAGDPREPEQAAEPPQRESE